MASGAAVAKSVITVQNTKEMSRIVHCFGCGLPLWPRGHFTLMTEIIRQGQAERHKYFATRVHVASEHLLLSA